MKHSSKKYPSILIVVFELMLVLSSGCLDVKSSHFDISTEDDYTIKDRNYTFAIYNKAHRLMTHPLEDLLFQLRARHEETRIGDTLEASTTLNAAGSGPITDIFIISHGWNYDATEAIANYHEYIKFIDGFIKKGSCDQGNCFNVPFRPYFIFITWTSTTRPFADLAKGVLPFSLNEMLRPATWTLDNILIHPLTTWQQSLNAAANALGLNLANRYHCVRREQLKYGTRMAYFDELGLGEDLPVSALIYELFKKREETCEEVLGGRCQREDENPLRHSKIHLVGHSYGAKLVAFAGMEALRRWVLVDHLGDDKCEWLEDKASDTLRRKIDPVFKNEDSVNRLLDEAFEKNGSLIESLVLFNPAFHPSEFSYILFGKKDKLLTPAVLRLVPRKAIVYSKYDHPNGLLFPVRELVLSARSTKVSVPLYLGMSEKLSEWFGGGLPEIGAPERQNPLIRFLVGSTFGLWVLGGSLVNTAIVTPLEALNSFPYTFVYHLKENRTFDLSSPKDSNLTGDLWKYPVNALDYFLPAYPFFMTRDIDQRGIFRLGKVALGSSGLQKSVAGRESEYFVGRWRLKSFFEDSPDVKPGDFCEFSYEPMMNKIAVTTSTNIRFKLYSFDANDVYDSFWFGSHSDLREDDEDDKPTKCPIRESQKNAKLKLEHTLNFVFNFTQTDFSHHEALRSY
jgi:hypothetical protein